MSWNIFDNSQNQGNQALKNPTKLLLRRDLSNECTNGSEHCKERTYHHKTETAARRCLSNMFSDYRVTHQSPNSHCLAPGTLQRNQHHHKLSSLPTSGCLHQECLALILSSCSSDSHIYFSFILLEEQEIQAFHNTNTFCWGKDSFRDSPDTCLKPQPKGSPTALSQLAVQVTQAGVHLTVVTYSVVVCIFLYGQWQDIGNQDIFNLFQRQMFKLIG